MIEQTYPASDHRSPRYRGRVKQIGLRYLVAVQVVDASDEWDGHDLPHLNATVVASFVREGQLYTFESVIQKCGGENGPASVVLRRPKRVVKVQRRFSYRVPVETRTTYRVQQLGPYYDDPISARIVNISEGGVLITTNAQLSSGNLVLINIPAGSDGETMEVAAEVLEVADGDMSKQQTVIARLRFDGSSRVSLSHNQREDLVKYLFEQQRMMLQTRRLLHSGKRA